MNKNPQKSKLSLLVLCACLSACNNGGKTSTNSSMSNNQRTPIAKYNHILLPQGPNASLDDIEKVKVKQPLNDSKQTYTYIRCYYTLNSTKDIDLTNTRPDSDYLWAKDSSGDYYKLTGYWNNSSVFAWENMFFTSVSLLDIKSICDQTLAHNSATKNQNSFYQVAADNSFSFNQTIWQNDSSIDNSLEVNKIIAFGDSLSDNNNMYNASNWMLPDTSSWYQGRFSNGRNWVEYLALKMNLPLYNWAIGGAEGQRANLVIPGLGQEVQSWIDYMSSANNYDVKRTLFTMMIGGNDFVNDDRTASDVLGDVSAALTMLGQHGAKNVLLLNLPDVTKAPVFHMDKDPTSVYQRLVSYNAQLPNLVKSINQSFPQMHIMLFDTKSELDKILAAPGAYGFTNTHDSCLNINTDSSINYTKNPGPRSSCTDASKFVFWDSLHPTTATHYALANAVYPFVKQHIQP